MVGLVCLYYIKEVPILKHEGDYTTGLYLFETKQLVDAKYIKRGKEMQYSLRQKIVNYPVYIAKTFRKALKKKLNGLCDKISRLVEMNIHTTRQ